MSTRRTERIAEAIREVVATCVLFELSDPRIRGVTVISAQVSPDLRHATVFVTVMGNQNQQKTALRGLQHAAGFLQSRVAARLQTKITPLLTFKIDEGLARSADLTRLIEETRAADRIARGETPDLPATPPLQDQEAARVEDDQDESDPEDDEQDDEAEQAADRNDQRADVPSRHVKHGINAARHAPDAEPPPHPSVHREAASNRPDPPATSHTGPGPGPKPGSAGQAAPRGSS
jgi:ribosome-binding factor A